MHSTRTSMAIKDQPGSNSALACEIQVCKIFHTYFFPLFPFLPPSPLFHARVLALHRAMHAIEVTPLLGDVGDVWIRAYMTSPAPKVLHRVKMRQTIIKLARRRVERKQRTRSSPPPLPQVWKNSEKRFAFHLSRGYFSTNYRITDGLHFQRCRFRYRKYA